MSDWACPRTQLDVVQVNQLQLLNKSSTYVTACVHVSHYYIVAPYPPPLDKYIHMYPADNHTYR